MWDSVAPLVVFQKRMRQSAIPPPLASRPCWWGDQAMALTAAVWSLNLRLGAVERKLQTQSLLSLPPLASSRPLGDQRSPHTCRRPHPNPFQHGTPTGASMLCTALHAASVRLESRGPGAAIRWQLAPALFHACRLMHPGRPGTMGMAREWSTRQTAKLRTHLAAVPCQPVLEVLAGTAVTLQNGPIAAATAQQVVVPGLHAHAPDVPFHSSHPAHHQG